MVFLEYAIFMDVRGSQYSFEGSKPCFIDQESVSDSGTLKTLLYVSGNRVFRVEAVQFGVIDPKKSSHRSDGFIG